MRWVQQASIRPHRCAVIPFIGSHNSKAGFIDTGQDMRDPDSHVYISVEAVEEMGRFIGWEPSTLRAGVEARLAVKDERIAELEQVVAEHADYEQAVEYTLGRFGAKVQKKPGRKVAA